MSLTSRDRKIVMALVPLLAILGFWFLLLSPKRAELKEISQTVEQKRVEADSARRQADAAAQARGGFADDYAAVVRLGKAVPATVDMPSLLVQLDRAAKGTRIRFERVSVGSRQTAAPAAGAPATSAPAPGGDAAAGGAPADSAPGQAAQAAGENTAAANGDAAQSEAQSGAAPESTTSQPAPGGSAPGAAAASGSPAPGLDAVPLDFTFRGRFFDLADFFHRLKRFVHLANDDIVVRGRLMTIDQMKLTVGEGGRIEAVVKASVYLSPKSEGITAGASPAGPAAPPAQPAAEQPATSTTPPATATTGAP